jgi:hypothetical protein
LIFASVIAIGPGRLWLIKYDFVTTAPALRTAQWPR